MHLKLSRQIFLHFVQTGSLRLGSSCHLTPFSTFKHDLNNVIQSWPIKWEFLKPNSIGSTSHASKKLQEYLYCSFKFETHTHNLFMVPMNTSTCTSKAMVSSFTFLLRMFRSIFFLSNGLSNISVLSETKRLNTYQHPFVDCRT